MNIALALYLDFDQSFLGGPSQLDTEIAGATVLHRTLRRAAQIETADHHCVFTRPEYADRAAAALRDCELQDRFEVVAQDLARRFRRGLIRAGRKWNLESWRGAPLGTTWFDEYLEVTNAALVLNHYKCEGVLCLSGAMPVLDPHVADAMLHHQRTHLDAEFTFTQAPPGLAGLLLRRDITAQLVEQNLPPGLMLTYRPEMPRMDMITKQQCCAIPSIVAQTPARWTADTRRSRETITAAIAALGNDCDALALADWSRENTSRDTESTPREVELELNTRHPLPNSSLRPSTESIPARELAATDALERLLREFATYDDHRLIIAGHGDPLLHPQFADILAIVKSAGVTTTAVVTPLVELPDASLDALLDHGVDLLEVSADAYTPETYTRLHGADHHARVLANIDRIQAAREARQCPQPIVAPSIIRCAATLHEIEPFYDYWIRQTGWAIVRGYNDYGGRLAADTLLTLDSPIRRPCRQLDGRLFLAADGAVAQCPQDIAAAHPLGDWRQQSLADIWAGRALAKLRALHHHENWSEAPLCASCTEWFRH